MVVGNNVLFRCSFHVLQASSRTVTGGDVDGNVIA